jgi:hypothetical protein
MSDKIDNTVAIATLAYSFAGLIMGVDSMGEHYNSILAAGCAWVVRGALGRTLSAIERQL